MVPCIRCQETVRVAADKACRSLDSVTVRALESSDKTGSVKVVEEVMPLLLTKGMSSPSPDIKAMRQDKCVTIHCLTFCIWCVCVWWGVKFGYYCQDIKKCCKYSCYFCYGWIGRSVPICPGSCTEATYCITCDHYS